MVKNKNEKTINKEPHDNLKFIDLCCGIGGFHQALSNMGMTCVMASDIDKNCRDNYEKNYKLKPLGDLTKIDVETIPNFDVLCAGFPCQPFSKAGDQKGFDDNRGNIFFDICKIAKHHRPKYLILENVRNLATHDKGNTWKVIKAKLKELKYITYEEPTILNTLNFNVPQSRERVVILCKREDLGELSELPKDDKSKGKTSSKNKNKNKTTSPTTTLNTIIEKNCSRQYIKKYVISDKMRATEGIWNQFLDILNKNSIDIPKYPIWTDWWDTDGEGTSVTKISKSDQGKTEEEKKGIVKKAQEDFMKKYKDWIDKNKDFYKAHNKILKPWLIKSRENSLWKGAVRKMEWQTGKNNLNMSEVLWSPRGSGVRIKNIDYSPTLVAMASMIPIYGPESRQLTPRECARLQSFPDTYIIHENDKIAYKQFGNAVNVKMIERSARFLINNEPLFL